MKFKFRKRRGLFTHFNARGEKHGNERVPAGDITVSFPITKTDLAMLFPTGVKDVFLYDCLYDDKGHLLMPFISPLTNARTPENVTWRCWDKRSSPKKPFEIQGCKIKGISIELADKKSMRCKLKIQVHDEPDRDTARIRWLCTEQEAEFELFAEQDDFFGGSDDDENETQPELDLTKDGESTEEETDEVDSDHDE